MVNLETIKKCYAEKKNLDKELIEQFKLIGKCLGVFTLTRILNIVFLMI